MLRPGLLVDVDSIPDGAVLLDTRLALTGPLGREQYDAGHLPGAAYVDVDADLADPPGAGGRHPLPDPERFVDAMRRAGVRRDSTVVVYDAGPATAAGRLWWLLRDHGHDDVLVLDGGLAAWAAAGRPVSTEPASPTPATGSAFRATSPPSATTRRPPCLPVASSSTSARRPGSRARPSRSTPSPATSPARSTRRSPATPTGSAASCRRLSCVRASRRSASATVSRSRRTAAPASPPARRSSPSGSPGSTPTERRAVPRELERLDHRPRPSGGHRNLSWRDSDGHAPKSARSAYPVEVHRAWGPSPGTVLSIDAWAQDALALLAALPGVRRVGLALVEGGGRRLRFTASDRDETPTLDWCDVDGYDDVPLNVALRSRRIVSGTVDELSVRFAEFVALQGGTATVALAAVPMESADRPVGGYVLFYDRPQSFDDRQHRELTRLGQDLGAALRRAQRGEARAADELAEATADGTGHAAQHRVTAEPAAVAGARRFLRGNLHDWDVDDETADTAVLCLSELVTNAVIHSHAGCAVRVRLDEGLLTTTVRDSGTADATTLAALDDPLQVHGRGLMVVEALASRWGYELDTEGTTVWFELEV